MKNCNVSGCNNKHLAKGLCSKHWTQMKRRGTISDQNRLKPNQIIVEGDIASIILCDTLGNEKARTVVDASDVDLVQEYKWYLTNQGYAMTRVNKNKQLFLHRLLMSPSTNMVVDHIDGNTLNNRRGNLRICFHRQNVMNQKIRKDNSSGFKGVGWDSNRNMWRSRIHVSGSDKHLGYFSNFEEATKARCEAEIKYFGEYSRKTNILGG